jgi:predicted amidophosphoribosyltransferase
MYQYKKQFAKKVGKCPDCNNTITDWEKALNNICRNCTKKQKDATNRKTTGTTEARKQGTDSV